MLLLACNRRPAPNPHGLDCALEAGASRVECAHVAEHQEVRKPELTGARELVLTALTASRTPTHLVVDATLRGAFRNAVDQNLYVFLGFVDHLSVLGVEQGRTRTAEPPMLYPSLDVRSHRFKAVSLREADGTTAVALEMAAPIADWAQTNLQFYFVPLPPRPLKDASHSVQLPYAWTRYCAARAGGTSPTTPPTPSARPWSVPRACASARRAPRATSWRSPPPRWEGERAGLPSW